MLAIHSAILPAVLPAIDINAAVLLLINRPDPGHVFVFLADGRQLFTAAGLAVQVPEAYANS